MHSFDRTLLAKFGFADADRVNPRHELACQYLATKRDVLAKRFLTVPDPGPCSYTTQSFSQRKPDGTTERVQACAVMVDCPVVADVVTHAFEAWAFKAEGKYRQDIGRVDLLIKRDTRWRDTAEQVVEDVDTGEVRTILHEASAWDRRDLVVEVKIAPVSVSDIIAQLGLYRAHQQSWLSDGRWNKLDPSRSVWLVVTDFPLTGVEHESLQNEGIEAMRLEPGWEEHFKLNARRPYVEETI